ncbi:MAG TPA: tetratricopeptide repeat protein [Cyclobacteriaceae bacterium]|nr:tetratricopeptide repeat protein [Cyclobacteriaceae bacterium]
MKVFSLALFLSCFSYIFAQNIASGQAVVREGADGYLREKHKLFELNYQLFGDFMRSDLREANRCLDTCARIANELGDSLYVAMVLHGRGYILLEQGNPRLAIECLKTALDISKRNVFKDRTIYILNSLAIAYSANVEYDKALLIHLESLRLRESNNASRADISVTLGNIGNVYAELGDYEMALEYYNRSYSIKIDSGFYEDIPYLIANIAATQINLHRYSESLVSLERARSFCDSISCDQRILSQLGLLEGTCQMAFGKVNSGLSILSGVSHELKKLNSVSALSECYFRIAVGLARTKRYHLAIKYCDSSGNLAPNLAHRKLAIKRLILRGKCMAALGRFDSAFASALSGYRLDSALSRSILLTRVSAVEALMQERENSLKIKAQEDRLRYLHNEIIDSRLLLTALISIAILGMFLLMASIRISRQRRKINSLLSERVVESTYELSNAQYSMNHSHETLKLMVLKLESTLQAEHATLSGLKMLSKFDSSISEQQYLEKADEACLRLFRIIKEFKEVSLK